MNQKGIAHIFILLLLFIGIGVGIYLIRQQTIFKPGAASAQCVAESVVSFRECINKVNNSQADIVEVQSIITCQKADNCEFTLTNIHRPVHLKGKKGVKAGFKRMDWFETPILRITNSEKVYVSDLVFDDNDQIKCAPYSNFSNPNDPNNKNSCYPQYCAKPVAGCDPAIVVGASNETTFDNIQVLYSKWIGLAIYDGSGHRILNSLFKATEDLDASGRPNGSGWYGFWTWNNTKQYEFINNKLINQQSNTAIFTSNTILGKSTLIKGNFFQNNGTLDLVNSGGGTIGIIPNFHYGNVLFNEVIEAKAVYSKINNWYSPNGGIEMDVLSQDLLPPGVDVNNQIHHANIRGNVIHGVEGIYGIGIGDKGFYNNVNIANNVIYDIRTLYPNWTVKPIDIQAGSANLYDNCIDNPGCTHPAYTTLTATPDVCLNGPSGRCESTVRWSSKSYPDVIIKNRKTGAMLGGGANGEVDFDWMNDSGDVVDLYSGQQLIESLVVRGGRLKEEINITQKGKITATPAQCTINTTNMCTAKIIWDLSGYPNSNVNVEIRVRESDTLFGAGGMRGEVDATWITKEGFNFDLYADGLPYDSVFVKGLMPGETPALITAAPNPCTLGTDNMCAADIKLNAPGYSNLQIKVRESGAAFTGPGANPQGSWNAPWINETGYNFDLYSNGNVIGSVLVKGQRAPGSSSSPPIGAFDGIVGSQVIAWACDLDVASTAPSVHIYIDDQFGWVATADKTGEAGIATYCGGFKDRRVITDIPDKYKDGRAHSVKIYAIDNVANGVNSLLQGSPKTFTLQKPVPIGKLTASVNPCPMPVTQTNCGVNGPQISWEVTNPTGDIVVKIKSIGQGFAGGALSGTAQAWFVDANGVTLELYTGNTLLDSLNLKAQRVNSPPVGTFDGIYGSQLVGWACDLDVASTAPDVHIYIDEKFGWVDKADKTGEPGIATYCGGFKDRGVVTDIPDKYKDGKSHSVHMFVIDDVRTGTNTLLNGSPKTFTINPQSPSPSVSPSPAAKTGDLDGDGDVDIFDFNLFLQDYKNGNLRSDLNNDGKVDIFDFNILLRSFGK